MKQHMFAIYDTKAEMYSQPYFFHNDNVAYRAAEELRNDPQSSLGAHPEDYTLFKIGTYCDNTATIESLATHVVICRFHEIPLRTIVSEASEETLYTEPAPSPKLETA